MAATPGQRAAQPSQAEVSLGTVPGEESRAEQRKGAEQIRGHNTGFPLGSERDGEAALRGARTP